MNFRQTSLCRTYNHSVVPTYLQRRPRSTILHCLHRKASSNKFCCNDIHDVDRQVGIFEVKGKNQTYKVDFGTSTGIPSCTSLMAEERAGVSKTARVSQRPRKATTISTGDHG